MPTEGSQFTHGTQDPYNDAPHSQHETISGRRRLVPFPRWNPSSRSSSSNYPSEHDLIVNPYAW